ncbi:glycerophosphodiester phosphodiesterase family protein [Lysinimonas soli]|uniref:glycerophosphodiester phosphodiesterase n=1 Tax=Lysinimonas soli TaxID=1074233 RepID=A0ABW0NRY9_9MICO
MSPSHPPIAPLVIGHRGAPGYRPEHTRASYELAMALGADAVEPDLVVTRDGVLVVRHENEISGTTDVARHPEFADRRVTKTVDGVELTGWFTEDFSWDELATLRAVERLPQLRQHSSTFDGSQPMLRLSELLELLDDAAERRGREVRLVAEVKHPSYFASIGMPLDGRVAEQLAPWGGRDRLTVECFEQTVLGQLAERGLDADYVYLLEEAGAAPDLVARDGEAATPYAEQLTDAGLARLAREVDGVSVNASLLLDAAPGPGGPEGPGGTAGGSELVARAHDHGLKVFTWTLRPENAFLASTHRRGSAAADWGDWRAEFELIIGTGVDGIFVDHPDLGLAARDGL